MPLHRKYRSGRRVIESVGWVLIRVFTCRAGAQRVPQAACAGVVEVYDRLIVLASEATDGSAGEGDAGRPQPPRLEGQRAEPLLLRVSSTPMERLVASRNRTSLIGSLSVPDDAA